MKKIITLSILFLLAGISVFSQVGINADNSLPNSSAMLDVNSTSKGALLPRMTYGQRNAIVSPAEGLIVFCTNCNTNGALCIYSNGAWRSFTACNTPSSTAGTNIVSPGTIIWNWTSVSGASGYKWNTTPEYETAFDNGTAISRVETGIACNNTYLRYVWVNDDCGISLPLVLSQTVSATPPASPVSGTHIANPASIVWNWNTVADAIGYKWNTVNDFASATEMGTATTKTENGLNCSTTYTRFVWAYNGCGNSTPVSLSQSTLICPVCGNSMTVSHLSNLGVAPVNKVVTYGTVNNIPGEPTKCWITRNLGASQQASASTDDTEASAGWYWQFNRKQGYQYTTFRTPNSAWNITNDNLSATWQASKDPCKLELGGSWRIPTLSEWTNVDASGGWTNLNGPFTSLNLHAAGRLESADGSLAVRGTLGYYWSNNQVDADGAWGLFIASFSSSMSSLVKSGGSSVRCVRDY
jgi:hypothetical protein